MGKEGRESTIQVTDAEPDVVDALLRYIYTGKLLQRHAMALLPLAHRYEISDLVGLCVREMLRQLSVKNVTNIVSLVNRFSEHEEVAVLWPTLLEQVKYDHALLEASMRSVSAPQMDSKLSSVANDRQLSPVSD